MDLNRKEFLLLTAAICAGCKTLNDGGGSSSNGQQRIVDAGPSEAYAADGVYQNFRSQGFFLVRKGSALSAVSAVCTHRKCKLNAEPDRSFHCPCHGSSFDPAGKVTHGPAARDLPIFPSARNAAGHLLVTVTT